MKICSGYNRCSRANISFLLYRRALLPWLAPLRFDAGQQPIIIGAMGGSGTRVLVPALQNAGVWMGRWLCARTQDAMSTRHLLQSHFKQSYLDPTDHTFDRTFAKLLRTHRHGISHADAPWGWKNPRWMWLLPFLAQRYPGMKFIHVIRDGRDMALTNNHNLLQKHGALLLNDNHCLADPVRSNFQLWAQGNLLAHEQGRRLLGDNYLQLDYDQLCADPHTQLSKLYEHVGVRCDQQLLEQSSKLIQRSNLAGQWRNRDLPLLHQPPEELAAALDLFGYV